MIKALAWATLAITVLFVALALTALFGWESLEGTAWWLAMAGAVPLAGLAIVLVLDMLVTAWWTSDSESES
ncbi:MAG: hypothetical protein NZ658_03015 [Pirellulales bacterium]|nr:hypothetical protein [Pirellulales bacterium]